MQFALSIYRGGALFAASESDYFTSRELGLICPFCKESVFLAKSHFRGDIPVAAAWRHYKKSINSAYCENRALSIEGKKELMRLQPQAQNQRLWLFNRRFWDLFKHKKDVPANLKKTILKVFDEVTLDKIVLHCHQRWDVDQILNSLPVHVKEMTDTGKLKEFITAHPIGKRLTEEGIDALVQNFSTSRFGVVRYKILSEAISWLATKSALESFSKIIYLSILDCAEVTPPPIHTKVIAQMALVSLIATDWEEAIASLEDKTRAIGFSSKTR